MYAPIVKMSSKGQIVIPKLLREELDVGKDDEFVAAASGDAIVLKRVKRSPVSKAELAELVASNQKLLSAGGYKSPSSIRALVQESIADVRASRR